MIKHVLSIATLLGITVILSGCGQSGPLYLPKAQKTMPTKTSTPSNNINNPPPLKQTEQVEDA